MKALANDALRHIPSLPPALLAVVILMLPGCQNLQRQETPSSPSQYLSSRLRPNVFWVHFEGDGLADMPRTQAMTELVAAQLALRYGYRFFTLFDESMAESPVEEGAGLPPLTEWRVVCFREEPIHLPGYQDARQVFSANIHRLSLQEGRMPVQPVEGPFIPDPNILAFDEVYAVSPQQVCGDQVAVRTEVKDFPINGVALARFSDFENPFATLQDFATHAIPIAAERGANCIVIGKSPLHIHNTPLTFDGVERSHGFVADLFFVPSASLGIMWEPGDMAEQRYVVRKFRDYSQAAQAGLKLQDQLIAIDDIDPLDSEALLERRLQWVVGDSVVVVALRDGRKEVFNIPLVENLIR